jgi:flavorubredoxin
MNARTVKPGVQWVGVVDWDRRLFDSLIPLPDGTSYNAYLITGSERVALVDSVDTPKAGLLRAQLSNTPRIDYVISNHAEPDHSGAIPTVLEMFPDATVVSTPRAREMLIDLFGIPSGRFRVVEDGAELSLGDKTLKFIHTPWVHWPETMVTYLKEERLLFSCDFFGSHIATSDLFVTDEGRVYEAAKRYFAEIMMPFSKTIEKNLEKLGGVEIGMIAPSHGPIYPRPALILDAYREWVSGPPKNLAVIPFVSMHGSTRKMVDALVTGLVRRGVAVQPFDLAVCDIGKLAMALVDAATIVVGTPTVIGGPHPAAAQAAVLANLIRPKARYLSIVGSYGWGGKAVEQLAALIPNLKVEVIPPVLCKGAPRADDLGALDALAGEIARRHAEI